jgi:hypothetical protein
VTNVFLNINTGKVMPVNSEFLNIWPDLAKIKKQKPESTVNVSAIENMD